MTALLTVFSVPHVVALAAPPTGRTFTGAFLLQDDFLQYASFAEQAGRGALFFANKFDVRLQSPFLLNPEWWLAGVLGRLVGSPLRGLQLLSLPALALFLAGVVRLLRLARSDGAIIPGLLLITVGSGLGWINVLSGRPPYEQADLVYLFFPSSHALGLWTHGLVGLGLLCWSLAFHLEWRRRGTRPWAWIATAILLGLCRPFDLVVFVAVGLSLLLGEWRHPATMLRGAAPWAWLSPLAFYLGLAFLVHPSFALWSGGQNSVPRPPVTALAEALGPAFLFALVTLVMKARAREGADLRFALSVWIAVTGSALAAATRFSLQVTTSIGLALLLTIAALAPRRMVLLFTLVLAPTTVVGYRQLLRPPAEWLPPRDYVVGLEPLRELCTPGDIVYAPSDPSLFVAASTPCRVAFGHRVLTPGFSRRAEESVTFFDEQTSPPWRLAYLDRLGARFVLLPAGAAGWLGAAPPFERVPGAARLFEIWRRREGP